LVLWALVLWAALPIAIPKRVPAEGAMKAPALVPRLELRTAVPSSLSSVVGREFLATWPFWLLAQSSSAAVQNKA
jgi:hypothetical protein